MGKNDMGSLAVLLRVSRFQEALAEVRAIYPRMELGQLDLLLTIALHPGAAGAELLEMMEGRLSLSGFYKTLSALSNEQPNGSIEGRVTGLSLITRVPDPDDKRISLLMLTPKGEELMERIAKLISGAEKETTDGH